MQAMSKIVVNPRSPNRLPFEEIILLKLHTVLKFLRKRIAPFASHRAYVLDNAFQVRKFLRCGNGDVSDATADIYQFCALRGREEGFVYCHKVELATGIAHGCHGLTETCAHGLIVGVDILPEVLVC